eukprot:Pgem_evm2s3040
MLFVLFLYPVLKLRKATAMEEKKKTKLKSMAFTNFMITNWAIFTAYLYKVYSNCCCCMFLFRKLWMPKRLRKGIFASTTHVSSNTIQKSTHKTYDDETGIKEKKDNKDHLVSKIYDGEKTELTIASNSNELLVIYCDQ